MTPQAIPSAADVVKYLDEAAELSGDPAILRASRAIRQQPTGRPKINDRAALVEVRSLLESGTAIPLQATLLRVARNLYPYDRPQSVAGRLRRKLKKTFTK